MRHVARISAVAALAIGVSTVAVMAAPTVTIKGIAAAWGPIDGGSNLQHEMTPAHGTGIYWGTGNNIDSKSGYSFKSISTPAGPYEADDAQSFALGDFWHFNRPITAGTAITSAVLTLTFNVDFHDGDGNFVTNATDFRSVFRFDHDETDNGANPCKYGGTNNPVNANGCADLVSVGQFTNDSNYYEDETGKYYLSITGFLYNNAEFTSFLTKEDADNKAVLMAKFTADPNVIPLPAAAWLLIGGLGCLGVAARRRGSKPAA